MFWQIYQKLMLSGFLSSGNLCLIHHLKLFWPHAASTASIRKGALYWWKVGFLMIRSTKNYQYWLFWCQWWSDHQYQESFWGNWALEVVEASEVVEVADVNEAGDDSKACKSLLRTSESSRLLNSIIWWLMSLYFDVLIFDRIMKTHVEF